MCNLFLRLLECYVSVANKEKKENETNLKGGSRVSRVREEESQVFLFLSDRGKFVHLCKCGYF